LDEKVGSVGPRIFGHLAENDMYAMVIFFLLAFSLYRFARKK